MVSVEKAISLIKSHVEPLNAISLKVENALGYTLSENIYSPIQMPAFPQSAMDGYAIAKYDKEYYKIIGEIAAGQPTNSITLLPGQAVRIFTGANVPYGANAIIAQESTLQTEATVYIKKNITLGENIRSIGEQIKTGETALSKGNRINPAAIGYLSALGITTIKVHTKPSVAVLITGSELTQPGYPLMPGKVYESNSLMLKTALEETGYFATQIQIIEDNFDATVLAISSALQRNECVIISGGISVGDYDYVYKALQKIGVQEIFYKVNQKPGKPLFFGKKGMKLIFALPGNPAAALSSYYIYAKYALDKMSGKMYPGLQSQYLPLTQSFTNSTGKDLFLKASIESEHIQILNAQNSSMLSSFSSANSLAYIPAEKKVISPGEKVQVFLLPNFIL